MRHGICPKCGSASVRAARNGVELGGRPNRAYLRPHLPPDFRGAAANHATELWAFCCVTCGYLEWHLLDPDGIAFIAANWAPVPPTTAGTAHHGT